MNNSLVRKLQPIAERLQRYNIIIAIILVSLAYGYLIYNSGKAVQVEPSKAAISEKYRRVKRPKIDNTVVQKLNDLQDNNINFQGLINEARSNPFTE